MNSHRFAHHFIGALLGTSVVMLPAVARAACATDTDCGTGFTCEVFTAESCTGYACVDGEPCPPPTCETIEYAECVPAPCTADSDCGEGMVCLEQSYWECPPVAQYDCADPGLQCPVPEPVECTETKQSTCAPRYMAPCTVDADCGPGFSCVPQESCACSGSSGGGTEPVPLPADGGTQIYPEPVPPGECTCTPSGVNYCQMQQITCSTNADCPSEWTCEQYASGGAGCAVPVYPDGGTGDTVCEPVPEPVTYSQCVPPYYYGYGYDYGGGVYASGDAEGTTSDPVAGGDVTNDTAEQPPSDVAANGLNGESSSNDDGGCQIRSGGANTMSALVFAALGLFAATRRRRRTRI